MGTVTQEQATEKGIAFNELQELAKDKECSIYPGSPLHVRKTRGGSLTVFNISEKARGEKIKNTKAEKKAAKSNI